MAIQAFPIHFVWAERVCRAHHFCLPSTKWLKSMCPLHAYQTHTTIASAERASLRNRDYFEWPTGSLAPPATYVIMASNSRWLQSLLEFMMRGCTVRRIGHALNFEIKYNFRISSLCPSARPFILHIAHSTGDFSAGKKINKIR